MLKLATKFAPRATAQELAYRAGFRFAELWLDQAVLADWQNVAERIHQYPFGYAMHFPNQLNLPAETLAHTVALYRQLDCRCLIMHQPMHDKFREALLQLDANLHLAVENHKLTPERFREWAERNDGLTLDVEHLWKFTLRDSPLEALLAELKTFLDQHAGKLRHVHLPGYWPGFREHRPMYCARELLWPVLEMLDQAGFEGLIVSEADCEFQNAEELRMDVLLFDAWRGRESPGSKPS